MRRRTAPQSLDRRCACLATAEDFYSGYIGAGVLTEFFGMSSMACVVSFLNPMNLRSRYSSWIISRRSRTHLIATLRSRCSQHGSGSISKASQRADLVLAGPALQCLRGDFDGALSILVGANEKLDWVHSFLLLE